MSKGHKSKNSRDSGRSPATRSSVGQIHSVAGGVPRAEMNRMATLKRHSYRRVNGYSVEAARSTIDTTGEEGLILSNRKLRNDLPETTTQLKMQRTEGSAGFYPRNPSAEKSAPRRKLTINDIRQQSK